jgi:hypothetical protein
LATLLPQKQTIFSKKKKLFELMPVGDNNAPAASKIHISLNVAAESKFSQTIKSRNFSNWRYVPMYIHCLPEVDMKIDCCRGF